MTAELISPLRFRFRALGDAGADCLDGLWRWSLARMLATVLVLSASLRAMSWLFLALAGWVKVSSSCSVRAGAVHVGGVLVVGGHGDVADSLEEFSGDRGARWIGSQSPSC